MTNVTISARCGLVGMMCAMPAACVLPSPLGDLDTDGSSSGAETGGGEASVGGTFSMDGSSETGAHLPGRATGVDILFVIDNSGSMGEEQKGLADAIDSLVDGLDLIDGVNYRIGITTTDNGNPVCGNSTSPEAGGLQLSSCLGRSSQFIFNGNPPADAAATCTDICTHQDSDISVIPTVVEGDDVPRARPWIEGGAGGTNISGVSLGEALRCVMPQGIAGCGFESPLESAYKAVLRSQSAAEQQFAFFRPDAHMVLVFVTDETDCSHNNEYKSIFLPEASGGNPIFWTDPTAPQPTSAVCWNAGVACTGNPAGYDECHAVNRDIDGNTDVPDEQAVLRPPSRYVEFFDAIRQEKLAAHGTSVFMFGLVGVPTGYPAVPIPYAPSSDPGRQADFGIGYGCESSNGGALPPVRQLEVIEQFPLPSLGSQLYSICDPTFSGFYDGMLGQLAPLLGT